MGFFDKAKLPVASMDGKLDNSVKIHTCTRCGLFSTCNTPKIPASGGGKRRILVIGPGVTTVEDNSGNERHGSTYSYLKSHFAECGIDLDEDCWYTHAVRCFTREEYTMTTQSACHRMLMKEIDELDPIVIVPVAPEAWEILLYERMTGRATVASYQDWCGEIIPDQVLNRYITPIYTPTFVQKFDEKRVNPYHLHWHAQMEAIKGILSKPDKIEVSVTLCDTESKAITALEDADENWKVFAFDYETTGIKPYREGHKIAYVSISNGKKAYAFPHYGSKSYLKALKMLLKNDAVKIAQNANFERSWTSNILGYEVNNLVEDTMLMQHCRNNRKPTGLKFMVYAKYGFLGYDSDADEYIRASTEDTREFGTNAFNRVFDAPVKKMLEYNAMDSLFTYWLYEDLPRDMTEEMMKGYRFFMEASIAFANMHEEGVHVDMDRLENTSVEIEKAIRPYIDKVMEDPLIVKDWTQGHKFNPRSDYDIRYLLFSILKLKPIEFTEQGQPSVDAEALEEYRGKVSIIEPIYEIKRLSKLHGTYIRQIRAEQNEGEINCFFNLNGVVTFRSSSSNINFQNQPKRDKVSRDIIRSLYCPRRGHFFQEIDLKGAEVSIAAAVTQDKNLMSYVSDPSKDMHRDLAKSIFMVDDVSKNLRGVATKGPFTFAEFYGSYYEQVALGMWKEINIPNAKEFYGFDVIEHLAKCGIRNYDAWVRHIKEQERVLWEDFFPGYQRWRDNTYDEFLRYGYIDYPTGFRYQGPASRNECLNAPVQGPAFHLNLWALTNIDRELREKGFNTRPVLQIHDSQIYDMDPAEEGLVNKICHKWLIEKPREHWSWINVPIMAEIEKGGIDQPWNSLQAAGFLEG